MTVDSTSQDVAIVVPTIGRPQLADLLGALAAAAGPQPSEVVVVDDSGADRPLVLDARGLQVRVVRTTGRRGPAAARNAGWRQAGGEWIAFLDDDVVPSPHWYAELQTDLADLPADVAGSQGRIEVPLPAGRRPTDWERVTAGLADGSWITADMAYRRSVLSQVGGFDERFPRAFREDADLALRVLAAGHRLVRGDRRTTHPVRPADDRVSVRVQAGNADDVLMARLHGREWRRRAEAAPGRRRQHLTTTAAGLAALVLAPVRPRTAAALSAAWLAQTASFARLRIAPGPRDRAEVGRMLVTSVLIPPVATQYWLRGLRRHRAARPWRGLPELVLLDRDGTLVHDVPDNGDPAQVRPVDGAREQLDRLRASGIRLGLVTNQSGIAEGRLTAGQVGAVNARLVELVGRLDTVQVCPHAPADGCACRKPAAGMVKAACAELGVDPRRTALIGDIGTDVEAALAAGAEPVLVPTPVTLPAEVAAAPLVARDLRAAVDLLLDGAR